MTLTTQKCKRISLLSLGVVSLIAAASAVLSKGNVNTNSIYSYLLYALAIAFIYVWFREDATENNYDAPTILRVGVVALPVVALPYYFFRTRGFSGGFLAVAKTFAFCLCMLAIYIGGGIGTTVIGASLGNASAQTGLGVMYATGAGVTQSYDKALEWFEKAANQGSSDAQFSLGVMYWSGGGVSQNYTEALRWYRKAADQGNARARQNIGLMYRNGQGVKRDYAEALRWFEDGCPNCVAWLLSTCPQDEIRDGRRALVMAEELTATEASAEHLDTLAAAYAETGRFQDAIRTQAEAIAKIERGTPDFDDYVNRLETYKAGKPWREE